MLCRNDAGDAAIAYMPRRNSSLTRPRTLRATVAIFARDTGRLCGRNSCGKNDTVADAWHGYQRNAKQTLSPAINPSSTSTDPGFNGLQPGRRVHHKRFGEGTIINMEGRGEHARVQVNFSDGGAKWLVCAYANLEMV